MKLIRDISTYSNQSGLVLAIGNFDGLHLGHQAIIAKAVAQAKTPGIPAAVMTFEPHPRRFFEPSKPTLRLMHFTDKLQQLRALGISKTFALRFNAQLANTSAGDFVAKLLVEKLNVRHVVVGHDFCFGKGREGNVSFLAKAAGQYGFGFDALEAVKTGSETISSSIIRAHLARGEMHHIRAMLGRNYSISGHVKHGQQRGRTIGVPTANISLHALHLPKFGVYAARVMVENMAYEAIVNIGVKPTFGHFVPTLEAHIFAFKRDIYGQRMHAELLEFIREEKRFEDVSLLKEQIRTDMKSAYEIHQKYTS